MLDFGRAYNVTPKQMNDAKNTAIEAIKNMRRYGGENIIKYAVAVQEFNAARRFMELHIVEIDDIFFTLADITPELFKALQIAYNRAIYKGVWQHIGGIK